MKKIYRLAVLALLLLPTAVSAQQWEPLFNGKNLKGWKQITGTAKFEARNGMIIGTTNDSKANTFLATTRDYGDFILEFDFLTEDVNSGVQLRSHLDKVRNLVYGYQFEIDRNQTGGIYDEARRKWLYRIAENPLGREAYRKGWNTARIEAIGTHIRTWINGIPCANLIDDVDADGFIALQVHVVGPDRQGAKIYWKNIRILTRDVERYATPTPAPVVNCIANTLTPEEIADGWKLLFDGETTRGWQSARKQGSFPDHGWTVEDGVLSVNKGDGGESRNGGDIITDRKYGNFILKVDFKLTPGANSGIKYFVDPFMNQGAGSAIGCEFQVLDDELHPDAKLGVNGNRTMGSLYDLIPAPKGIWETYTIDGWQRAMIIVNGNHVEHRLNGHKLLEYERNNQMWDAFVDYSKYKDWPNFGNAAEGYILLQDHGDQVSYRNIKIKELPKASGVIPANKKEVIDRFLAGTLDPSFTPALFFGHFGGDQKLGEEAVKAHLSLFLKGGSDILKIQTEQPMPYIDDLTMDTPLVPEDWYRPTVEVIKEVLSYVGQDVYVMPTILSTHQVARQGFGDDRLTVWAVERPEAYKRMLDSYTKAILWYIRECKRIGVEAFFTATQGGEQKFYELAVPGGFFETWIRPYDLEVMNEAAKDTKFTILHICDWEGPMDDLSRYLEYPGKIVNVPLSIDGQPLSLTRTCEMFGRPVLGGFDRKAEIGTATPEWIARKTREIIAGGPQGHLMIGADCSVPSPLKITDNIHAAVSAAHGR